MQARKVVVKPLGIACRQAKQKEHVSYLQTRDGSQSSLSQLGNALRLSTARAVATGAETSAHQDTGKPERGSVSGARLKTARLSDIDEFADFHGELAHNADQSRTTRPPQRKPVKPKGGKAQLELPKFRPQQAHNALSSRTSRMQRPGVVCQPGAVLASCTSGVSKVHGHVCSASECHDAMTRLMKYVACGMDLQEQHMCSSRMGLRLH
jgi:hypothetical protein